MRHPFSLSILALSLAAFTTPGCLAAPDKPTAPLTCPVDLSASQHPGGVLLPASQIHYDDQAVLKPHMPVGQHTLDFSVKNNQLQRIVFAELAVHGSVLHGPLRPLSGTLEARNANEPSTGDVVRTIQLSSSIPAGEERTSFLGVHNLTTVDSVEIMQLRYADGSTWTAGPARACIAPVSGMMLIAGK
jgi:hypothetical protein